MESFASFPAPPERVPDPDLSKQKPRWNFFEMFKKRNGMPAPERQAIVEMQEGKQAGKQGEITPVRPERRRFAATVISLLGGEIATPAIPEPALGGEAVLTAERVTRPSDVAEIAEVTLRPETLPFVERAKEMGRGVLRMITHAREEVVEADKGEHFTNPTSLEPLAAADADVRAAMEELIAPIEALRRPARDQSGDTIEAAVLSGGDRDPAFLFEPKTPLARTLQVAAAVASVTAREVLHAKERALTRTGIVRKAGLFALGAATVGGFVYTWNRMRDIKKEQRAMRREHKRFEAEARAGQEREERRLHELEETNVQRLTPPERRLYVEEVSEFAHKQAAEIRTAARTREIVYQPEPASMVDAPLRQSAVRQPGRPEAAFYDGSEASRTPQPAPSVESSGLIERLGNVVSGAKNTIGGGVGSGIAAAGSSLVGTITGKPEDTINQPQTDQAQQQPVPPPRKSSQAWLWGFMLGVAVVIFIVLWGLRIL